MRITVFICALFLTVSAQSQSYDLSVGGQYFGWSSAFDMKGVTVEPTRIIVHTVFFNKYQHRTVIIPQNMQLYIPDIYRSIPVSSIKGADFGSNTMKLGKRHPVDFVCSVDWNELIRYSDNPLFIMNILKMRLTTNKDFTENAPVENSDWRIDFQIPLSVEQQITLGCASFLTKLAIKGEFETTAGYNARLKPDSVKNEVMNEMERLVNIATIPDVARLSAIKPQLSYNADAELFTLNYNTNLAQPVQIKVPIARAKELKDGYASGRFQFSVGALDITKEGNYFIGAVKVYDSQKKQWETFANAVAPSQTNGLQWMADKVVAELSKKHPNGKLLKG